MAKTFINGIDLSYNLEGSGEPMVLVHGLGMDQTMWDLQIPEFSKNYQVVVYDLRGHGQSQSPDHPYSIDLFAEDLDYFMHFLGLKKAIFLGLSLGGRIVLRYALKFPATIRALILADSQSEAPEESKPRFKALADLTRREGMGRGAEEFFSLPLLQSLSVRDPHRFQKEKARLSRGSAVGFAHSCLAIANMEPLTGRLAEIQASTLALAGELDGPCLPYLDTYSRRISNCRKALVPGAGHLSNLENAQAFNEAVLSFLRGQGKP